MYLALSQYPIPTDLVQAWWIRGLVQVLKANHSSWWTSLWASLGKMMGLSKEMRKEKTVYSQLKTFMFTLSNYIMSYMHALNIHKWSEAEIWVVLFRTFKWNQSWLSIFKTWKKEFIDFSYTTRNRLCTYWIMATE